MFAPRLCSSSTQKDYAAEIAQKLNDLGIFADVDNGDNTLPKKIRNGEIAQYNFILGERDCPNVLQHDRSDDRAFSVVGQAELETRSVNVRNRDNVGTKGRDETVPLDDIIQKFVALRASRSLENKLA